MWGEGGDFWSVGFVVVVLTLVGPFSIALRFFARPQVTPMREGGGESTRSTMRLVRVCDLRRGLLGVGVWGVVESGGEFWV